MMHPMMRVCDKGGNRMDNKQKKKGLRRHQLLGVLILILILPAPLLASEAEKTPTPQLAGNGEFTLRIHKNLISLKAQEASLRAILEEMGREMRIEVIGDVSEDEKISTEFTNLPMAEALQRLSSNYGYQIGSETGKKKMTKIFVLPKGAGTGLSGQAVKESVKEPGKDPDKERPPGPEPFKFEFDPSAFIKR
jgi:hypothetical protein